MSSWFNKPDPKDQMRENNKNVGRPIVSWKTIEDHWSVEKNNWLVVLVKQLVQLRKQKAKRVGMSSRFTGIGAQNNQMYSMSKMSQVMDQTGGTMKTMEKLMPVERVQRNERGSDGQERLGLSKEMMNDAFDSILDEPGDEEEQNAIVN